MPAAASLPVKAVEVNCEPWSVLKISGVPKRASASSSASMQKRRVQGIRQPPGQDRPAGPVDDRHQIEEAASDRDVGDVRRPDLVGPVDRHTAQQVGEDLVSRRRLRGVLFRPKRRDPHPAHQPLHPLAVHRRFPSIPVISISDAQRRPVPRAGWRRTVHHGLPERLLTPQPVKPTYFAFLGRISPEKAVDQAIWIAKRCGVPLKIAAKVDAVDRDYFETEIRKLLTPPDVEYIGEINDSEKSNFLSGAIALLAPIAWPSRSGWY